MEFLTSLIIIGLGFYLFKLIKNKAPLIQKTNNIIMDSKKVRDDRPKTNYKKILVLFIILQVYIVYQLDLILEFISK